MQVTKESIEEMNEHLLEPIDMNRVKKIELRDTLAMFITLVIIFKDGSEISLDFSDR